MSEAKREDQSVQDVKLPNDYMRYLCEIASREISDDSTDEEELEWDTLFAQPHVQAGLNRLAEAAKRQRPTLE